jgi:hypothetical protein
MKNCRGDCNHGRSECEFRDGCEEVHWTKIAQNMLLAIALGASIAGILFLGWSGGLR